MQLGIGGGDLGGEGQAHAGRVGCGRAQLERARVALLAQAAEQTELPAGVEAEHEAVEGDAADRARRRLRRARAGVAGAGIELGPQLGGGGTSGGARLVDARERGAQVAVVGERLVDQLVEQRVAERAPPGGVARRRREHRIVRGRALECVGTVRVCDLVARADAAARRRGRDEKEERGAVGAAALDGGAVHGRSGGAARGAA